MLTREDRIQHLTTVIEQQEKEIFIMELMDKFLQRERIAGKKVDLILANTQAQTKDLIHKNEFLNEQLLCL